MTLNTITPGVDTSFSTKLNTNFNHLEVMNQSAAKAVDFLSYFATGGPSIVYASDNLTHGLNINFISRNHASGGAGSALVTATNLAYNNSLVVTTAGSYTAETYSFSLPKSITSAVVSVNYDIFKVLRSATTTSGLTATDVNLRDYDHVRFHYRIYSYDGDNGFIGITDGSTTVPVLSVSTSSEQVEEREGVVNIYCDWDNDIVVFDNSLTYRQHEFNSYAERGFGQYVDTSSLTTSSLVSTDPANLKAYETGSSAADANIYRILAKDPDNITSTLTVEVSADGGANYTEATTGFVSSMTSGNKLRVRVSGTLSSGEMISINSIKCVPVYN